MGVFRLEAGTDTARIGIWDSSFTEMGNGWLGSLGCLGFVASFVLSIAPSYFAARLHRPLVWVASATAAAWLLVWILSRTRAYKSIAKQVATPTENEAPIVLELSPHDGSAELEGGFVDW
jgi:hypothetical protein